MYPTSRKMYTSPIVCLFGTENVFLFWSRLWGKKMNKTNQLNLNKSWTYTLSLPFYFQTALHLSRYRRYVNGREYFIAMSLERLTFFCLYWKLSFMGRVRARHMWTVKMCIPCVLKSKAHTLRRLDTKYSKNLTKLYLKPFSNWSDQTQFVWYPFGFCSCCQSTAES